MADLRATGRHEPSGWAVGWITFAAVMMIVVGFFHAIAGLAGIVDDDFYVEAGDYILEFDTTTWGWIHLVLGVVLMVSGAYLFTGAVLARAVGVVVAAFSMLAGFSWIPWYPIWGITMVAVSAAVIWALTAHGRDVTEL